MSLPENKCEMWCAATPLLGEPGAACCCHPAACEMWCAAMFLSDSVNFELLKTSQLKIVLGFTTVDGQSCDARGPSDARICPGCCLKVISSHLPEINTHILSVSVSVSFYSPSPSFYLSPIYTGSLAPSSSLLPVSRLLMPAADRAFQGGIRQRDRPGGRAAGGG